MTDMTITQGARSVGVHVKKLTRKIAKKWDINSVATTSNRRADTTTTSSLSVGSTAIPVSSISNFQARDGIYISGTHGSLYHSETQTIASIGAQTLGIEGTLQNSYDSGASVLKIGRFISYDFNRIEWQITAEGVLNASDTATLEQYASELEAMTISGGNVTVTFSGDNGKAYKESAITSLIIEEVPEEPEITDYTVVVTFMVSTKETST